LVLSEGTGHPKKISPSQKQPWASKKYYPHIKNNPGHPKNIIPISKNNPGHPKNIILISKTTLGIKTSRSSSQERPWESKRNPPSHKKPDIKKIFSRPKNDGWHTYGWTAQKL